MTSSTTETSAFSSISLSVDNNTDSASASASATSLKAAIDNVTVSENLTIMSSVRPLETTLTGNLSVSFDKSGTPPNNSTLTASMTDLIIKTSTSATMKFVTTSNPCSNDNPSWDSATQLCPNSTTDFQYLFDGAFTTATDAATVTTTIASDYSTEQSLTNSSSEVEFPSGYSCTDESNPEEQGGGMNDGNNDSEREAVFLRFDYEIYTPPNPTEDMINATLNGFERKLVYGVAHAVGLVDCQNESFRRNARRHTQYGGQKLSQRNYSRRSLRRKALRSATENPIVEVSMNPTDFVDTTLLACTSLATLDDPNECTPIHGFMTAWISKEQAGRIRQLSLESNSDYQTPEKYLLSTIQSYIEENQTSYLTDNLLQVAFIGERDFELNDTDQEILVRPVAPQADTEASNNISSKYIGIGIGSVFFAILLAGLVFSYYQNKQSERNLEENVEMEMEAGNRESNDDVKRPESSSKSSGSFKDEDGAFPSVNNIQSMVASDGGSIQDSPPKLLLKESDVSHDSSIWTSLDPNIPTEDIFGLRGKVCSDEYPVTQQKKEELNDSQTIALPRIMNNDNGDQHEDAYSSGSGSDEPLNVEPSREDDNMSPSEDTEKMGNIAPFLVEDAHSAIEEDDVSSLDSHDNVDIEGLEQDSLPSLV